MKNKKLAAVALAAAMALSCVCPAFALNVSGTTNVVDGTGASTIQVTAEATQMTVTVPTILPMSVDAQGNTTVATDAKVVNKSYGAVEVQALQVTGKNSWTLVGYDHDFTADKVGSKNFALDVDGEHADAANSGAVAVSTALGAQIDGMNTTDSDERGFSYDGQISPQKVALTDTEIATVTFTIDWAE